MGNVSSSHERSRAEIADYLRKFADELDSDGARSSGETDEDVGRGDGPTAPDRANGGGKVTIVAGNESATINPPETLTFDVEVETDTSVLKGRATERSATFSLRWNADYVEEDDDLSVQ
ncbi:amphi-Trp domain-containing protein [Halalkalicoccus sp. GCM10025322]|uniref:amphi-Trp domain-containing protein n=1 Tax=Halalkalicoccus TaxID=332246 RepID=UPI002F96E6F3